MAEAGRTDRRSGARMTLVALGGVPLIEPGDDLATIICDALRAGEERLRDGDVLAIAQKVVSKAEGRHRLLASVSPSARAREVAQAVGKDARLVELILAEAEDVLAYRSGVLVVAHRLGYVLANAGIDRSNVEADADGEERVLLLPEDPDRSAAELRERVRALTGATVGVVITDSVGRAWRNGTVGMALGAAGISALLDLRGRPDLFGRRLEVSQTGLADELAAAASLLMGQADEGRPVVLIRGLSHEPGDGRAHDLVRARELDLFR